MWWMPSSLTVVSLPRPPLATARPSRVVAGTNIDGSDGITGAPPGGAGRLARVAPRARPAYARARRRTDGEARPAPRLLRAAAVPWPGLRGADAHVQARGVGATEPEWT